MKLELKSIGIWSLIKISVFINMITGFIFGVFYAIMMSFMASTGLLPLDMVGDQDITLIGMLIFVPIMFSIGGAVFGTIWAVVCVFIYNVLTKLVGGLEITTNDITIEEDAPKLQPTVIPSTPSQPQPPVQSLPNADSSLTPNVDQKNEDGPPNNYEI